VWSDIVLGAERDHLVVLFFWCALSILAATAVVTLLTVRRIRSPLLTHFAAQMAGWGIVLALIALYEWRDLQLRDLAGAARLERLVWMNVGLDVGYAAVGITLVLAGHRLARSAAAMGAGVGILVQGLALLLLDVHFAALVSR
jgi:hypothetical protein